MRIGHGFDAHRFVEGRRLVLGGVVIDYTRGLMAHSDGDVLIHALCDALLGAVGLGDIGMHFPDTDATYKNADSRQLLRAVIEHVQAREFVVANVDVSIIAQVPKLAPYIAEMRLNLASDLNVAESQVNIKATTTEGMGYTGRSEGMSAHAVCLLQPNNT